MESLAPRNYFIEECGDAATDIIVKADQEPAITILMKDLMEERGDVKGRRTVLEEAPVKSKGSNGQVERDDRGAP